MNTDTNTATIARRTPFAALILFALVLTISLASAITVVHTTAAPTSSSDTHYSALFCWRC